MPLVTGLELLSHARRHAYGVGAFNTDNLETTQAIMEAAEETQRHVRPLRPCSGRGPPYGGLGHRRFAGI